MKAVLIIAAITVVEWAALYWVGWLRFRRWHFCAWCQTWFTMRGRHSLAAPMPPPFMRERLRSHTICPACAKLMLSARPAPVVFSSESRN